MYIVRQVCIFWRTAIDSSLLLRVLVDLGMHGKEIAPMNSLTTSQCYEAPEAHEIALHDLVPSRRDDGLKISDSLDFALTDGLHAELRLSRGHVSLQIIQLPSVLTNTGLREWYSPGSDFTALDFAIDFAIHPEQDLILLLTKDTPNGCDFTPTGLCQ